MKGPARVNQVELAAVLARLRQELDADLAAVGALSSMATREAELRVLVDDLDRQLDRMREAAVVTLVGATGAGKSTLLNALVGDDVAEEGLNRPTTVRPVVYAPLDAELSALLDGVPGEKPAVVRYDARGLEGPWREQVLVDAPDTNSVAVEHRAVVRALAERSDVLVVVVHHQSLVEESSVSFVDEFARRRRMVFVLGRGDELNADARAALLEDLARLARERWDAPDAPVLCVSAKEARERPDAPGWRELCAALSELVQSGGISGVRRHNAIGTADRIASVAAGVRGDAEEDLGALERLAGEGASALAARLAREAGERMRVRRADLAARLWAETAKRWDGPGGWVLRAQGLATLGLGAGAMLVRRNPLLAAGAAGAGLAVDQARKLTREHRLATSDEFVPGEREFDRAWREELGSARLAAGRLAGSADALGLPESELARERVAAAVGEAWTGLLDRDLPASAERAVPLPLRWVLDGPVYALAAWVVWRASVGFFHGEYAGVDFLLNALLLSLAYLFVVRLLVRRWLGARVDRLLDGAMARTADELAGWADEVREGVRLAAAGPNAALARLARLPDRWRQELGER